jgi:hypothetical protein
MKEANKKYTDLSNPVPFSITGTTPNVRDSHNLQHVQKEKTSGEKFSPEGIVAQTW